MQADETGHIVRHRSLARCSKARRGKGDRQAATERVQAAVAGSSSNVWCACVHAASPVLYTPRSTRPTFLIFRIGAKPPSTSSTLAYIAVPRQWRTVSVAAAVGRAAAVPETQWRRSVLDLPLPRCFAATEDDAAIQAQKPRGRATQAGTKGSNRGWFCSRELSAVAEGLTGRRGDATKEERFSSASRAPEARPEGLNGL